MHLEQAQQALDDLLADWQRQGGLLSVDHIERVIQRRNLDRDDAAFVLRELASKGVDLPIDDSEVTEDLDRERPSSEGMRSDPLAQFLAEIGQYRLLYQEDEVILGRRMVAARQETGEERLGSINLDDYPNNAIVRRGVRAWKTMVRSNLRLVVSIAKKHAWESKLELLDLIQEGTIGLMRAADKFDHTLGYKFSTYATWWIRQSITRSVADSGRTIRIPVYMHEKLTTLYLKQRALRREHGGKEPDLHELADAMGVDPGEIQFLLELRQTTISLDAPLDESSGAATRADLIPDELAASPEEIALAHGLHDDLDQAMSGLSERDRHVVEDRFGLRTGHKRTLEDLGTELGVTRERVRQIEKGALSKMRSPKTTLRLAEYLFEGEDTHSVVNAARPPTEDGDE